MKPIQKIIRVGILTISDSRTESNLDPTKFDLSGQNLKELIDVQNIIDSGKVTNYECITDDYEIIKKKMIDWCSSDNIDVLLSTGGTGLSPRDVTPEATLGIIQKLTPGITQTILNESLKITPMAMLSRAVSGICKSTLVINLPGSKKASEECLRIVSKVIPHAVSLIRDEKDISNEFHIQIVKANSNKISTVPDCVTKIALRNRESPYSKISIENALSLLKEHSFERYLQKNISPNIWIFSTGDELKNNEESGKSLIRDTNSSMIQDILYNDRHFNIQCGQIISDDWYELCCAFQTAFVNADVIVTSGGVSMGEKDLIKHVLKEHFHADIHFGRVNLKPGLPTTFATLNFEKKKKFIFCLPGNPVSAGVCTHLFVLPFLRSAAGRSHIFYSLKAMLTHRISNLDIRPEFKRASLKYENGKFNVSCLIKHQQSSRLLSFVGSNCLLQLPSSTEQNIVEAGTICNVFLTDNIESIYYESSFSFYNNEVWPKESYSNLNIQILLKKMKRKFFTNAILIPIELAEGHSLFSTIYSPENLPPYCASIKDGYAIKLNKDEIWHNHEQKLFKVVQISVAGTEPSHQKELEFGDCARISTGAPLPPGANCVVQVEDTSLVSKSLEETLEMEILVLKKPKILDNIRNIGSDIALGQELLCEGVILNPYNKGLLKSVGIDHVTVYKTPNVEIIPHVNSNTCEVSKMLCDNICKGFSILKTPKMNQSFTE
ncbi:molybdenum cofactor synthesis protein cinnamon isoform X2 [Daktulosphaira vitifoliae]|uniref:molybdenum cofactor synthesis protein cinnamon isoform X2 n=1 Tax=Daktulosphaira vitifoliae TaxID=58002 RepID=UPI0021A9F9C9|nr:molybdenum cofactor synthesis protein cinnamon isoform X2 [Daktulosphaira vitifoliae]